MSRTIILLTVALIGFAQAIPLTSDQIKVTKTIYNGEDIQKIENFGLFVFPVPVKYLEDHLFNYTYGEHIEGEEIVVDLSERNSFSAPMTISMEFAYPAPGIKGNTVTYVELKVAQSNDLGECYIVSGGIGQREIKIFATGRDVLYFHYTFKLWTLKN